MFLGWNRCSFVFKTNLWLEGAESGAVLCFMLIYFWLPPVALVIMFCSLVDTFSAFLI